MTFGFVSGIERTFRGPRGRRITGSLEHTAPLLPGSSGGPVLGAGGQRLGINTNRLGEGFYLAVPADEALQGHADALELKVVRGTDERTRHVTFTDPGQNA